MQNCNFDSLPIKQPQNARTPTLVNTQYTSQDFHSIKLRLYQKIQEQFADNFNNFVEGDLSMLFMENIAFVGDLLMFKMDQYFNEMFTDSVTEIENAFRLAKSYGFQPTPPIPSTASFALTLGSLLSVDMIIPAPISVSVTANTISTTFELFPADDAGNPIFNQDIIITAGNFTNNTIIGIEGSTKTTTFSGNGTVNQVYNLPQSPVIYDSVSVLVDGITWEQVNYFTDGKPRREFRTEFNSNYSAFVVFGNNKSGAIPANGSQIQISYRVGGGTYGNITTGTVQMQQPFSVPGIGKSIPVNITNYTQGSNGYDGDTIEDIRTKLPAYIRTQNRAVTADDYQALVDQFATPYSGMVGKSTVALRNSGCSGNIIDVFVLAANGINDLQTASSDLKYQISQMLNTVKTFNTFVCIKDGNIIYVDVSVELTMNKFYAKMQDEISTKVTNSINQFFDLNNWDYGESLKDTDIVMALSNIKELSQIFVNFTTNDPLNMGSLVSTSYYQIIRPENITLSFTFE